MMRTAMKLNRSAKSAQPANDVDPREEESAEVIDLASRNAYPTVTQRRGKASDGLGMVAGIAIVAGLGALTLWGMNSSRLDQPEGVGGEQTAVAPAPATAGMAGDIAQPEISEDGESYIAPQTFQSQPSVNYAEAPSSQVETGANPYASPAMVFDASGRPVPGVGVPGSSEPGIEGDESEAVSGSAGDFASRIGGVGGGTAQATAMANPSTTVTQGTLIPAILETAIDTNVPGYVRAVVSKDVRSFDGTRVLVPRSSRLIGQYQSGLQNGQKRAYVIWTRLIRPDGASVNLASPAIGFDGTTGLKGKVSSNFFQRFGSAMVLSVLGGLSAAASGGTSVVLGGGSDAASAAVQQNADIGPTVRVKQGQPIRVFTARDLDFTQVSG